MYITVKSIKRNLGFKGIEVADLIIGTPILFIFIILFSFTSLKLFSLVLLVIGIFMLIPVTVSKKNRMYKVLGMFLKYILSTKEAIFLNKDIENRKVAIVGELFTRIRKEAGI